MPSTLPFLCPDLVLPISGARPVGSVSTSIMSELEKKFMLGLKLSISRNVQTDFEKWIVYLAFFECFTLHMWKPSSGELRHIHLVPELKITKDDDENLIHVHAVNEDGSHSPYVIQCASGAETTELFDFLIRAQIYDPAESAVEEIISTSEGEIEEKSESRYVEETTSRETVSSRHNDGMEMTAEEFEKYQKRQALGSLSRRVPSWKGVPGGSSRGKNSGDKLDSHPPPSRVFQEKQSSVARLSNVFDNVDDDDNDGSDAH